MIKFLLKVIVVMLLLFGLSNYANYLITGKTPDIPLKKPTLPKIDMSKLTDSVSEKIESIKKEKPSDNTYLYKWRDDKGVIHYTSERPKEDIQKLESIKINNNTNVVPSASKNNTAKTIPAQQQPSNTDLPANLYSPEGVKNLINQAKDVQNLVNDQFYQQENIIENN
jgi:uncharacterized protein DUF4124